MISGDQYIRLQRRGLPTSSTTGYPKDLAKNTEDLPRSSQVRAGSDGSGTVYVFDNAREDLREPAPADRAETFPTADLGRGTFGTDGG